MASEGALPLCSCCGMVLICPNCGSSSATYARTQAQSVHRPRPRDRAAALRGEQTQGYGALSRAGVAQPSHRAEAVDLPTAQQLHRLRSLLRRLEDSVVQRVTTHSGAEAAIRRLLLDLDAAS